MTYNTHGCVGVDRRLDPERIARVIAAANADVVALQELDCGRRRSGGCDQPVWLAERLGMHVEFCAARDCDGGRYGNAVLSRYPLTAVRQGPLPRTRLHSETRAAQWVVLDGPAGALNVLNTHLALTARERLAQAQELASRAWLLDPRCDSRTVLCGDFNALPRSKVLRTLSSCLNATASTGTYPSPLPLLKLDYVLIGGGLRITRCQVPRTRLTLLASDHLPVIVDLELGVAAA